MTFSPPHIARLQKDMQAHGLDVLLCLKPENSFYLTGFNPIIYSHPVVAILPAEGAPILLVHALRDDHARSSTFVQDIRLYGAWSTKVTMGPSWLAALKAILAERKVASGTIGIEEDFVSIERFREFQALLPSARFADGGHLVFEARMVKDAGEIAQARIAAKIADVGMEAAVATLRDGGSERDVTVASQHAMNAFWAATYPDVEVCDFGSLEGGVPNGLWTWCLAGDRMFMNSDVPTPRKPQPGELAGVFIWTNANGIHAENERTVAFGPLAPEVERAFQSIVDIRREVTPLIRPGARVADLFDAVKAGFEARGYGRYLPGRIGHGIGLGAHEHMSIDAPSTRLFEPGTLFTFEPNLRIPGLCGTQISDTVLVTATGSDFLTQSEGGFLRA